MVVWLGPNSLVYASLIWVIFLSYALFRYVLTNIQNTLMNLPNIISTKTSASASTSASTSTSTSMYCAMGVCAVCHNSTTSANKSSVDGVDNVERGNVEMEREEQRTEIERDVECSRERTCVERVLFVVAGYCRERGMLVDAHARWLAQHVSDLSYHRPASTEHAVVMVVVWTIVCLCLFLICMHPPFQRVTLTSSYIYHLS